ncbi:cell division protein ZapA [Desulfurispira natronophila]|uniref:Cell division protein ZapA n=1 Tax=Desulfurispira natronophila TaxID=682562 RepID=A0A7W7Y4Q0_9BACT|nr:cell division protein ZapA [Desulfurispira natronophila]
MQVTINGQRYTLRGGESSEHVTKVASYVDGKFQEISQRVPPHTSSEKVAVLVALNIAEELFRTQQQHEELENHARNQTLDILKVIDGKLNV